MKRENRNRRELETNKEEDDDTNNIGIEPIGMCTDTTRGAAREKRSREVEKSRRGDVYDGYTLWLYNLGNPTRVTRVTQVSK